MDTFAANDDSPTISEPDAELPATNCDSINQLTLELLLNHTHYRKYMSKSHPNEYEKRKQKFDQFEMYEPQISQLMMELIENRSTGDMDDIAPTRDIRDAFNELVDACIDYFRNANRNIPKTHFHDDDMGEITHFEVKKQHAPVPSLYLDEILNANQDECPSPPSLKRSQSEHFVFPSPIKHIGEISHNPVAPVLPIRSFHRKQKTSHPTTKMPPSYTLKSFF